VRHHVAEAGEIDLGRIQQCAQRGLGGHHDLEQMGAVGARQVGHFGHVFAPDHAAEARVSGVIDADDPAAVVFPDDVFGGQRAQWTIHGRSRSSGCVETAVQSSLFHAPMARNSYAPEAARGGKSWATVCVSPSATGSPSLKASRLPGGIAIQCSLSVSAVVAMIATRSLGWVTRL